MHVWYHVWHRRRPSGPLGGWDEDLGEDRADGALGVLVGRPAALGHQVLPVGDVAARPDPGGGGDVGDRHLVEAAPAEQRPGRFEDALAGAGAGDGHAPSVPPYLTRVKPMPILHVSNHRIWGGGRWRGRAITR